MTPEIQADATSPLAGYAPPLLKPRSGLRWGVFVAVNLAGYSLACAFWQYLRTGRWLDLSASSFQQNLAVPMGQMLLQPLGIFTHPWMIAVYACLLAVLLAVPLCVAVMYPLLLAMAMVVIAGLLAQSPMLALALAAGCLLAARSRLRRNWPFWACVLGLLPVAVYLYLLVYAGIDASLLLPMQRWLLAGPYLAAMLLSVLAAATVVGMARLSKFQPGVVWPVLVVLLPASMGLFYIKVGPAEMDYALLRRDLRPTGPLLPAVPREEFLQQQGRGLFGQTLLNRMDDALQTHRDRLRADCEAFLGRYPDSPRGPSVAWIAARAESLQLDRADPDNPLITFSARYTLPGSREAWKRLAGTYPDSDPASLAAWHLAELELRDPVRQPNGKPREPKQRNQQLLKTVREVSRSLRKVRDRLEEITKRQQTPDDEHNPFFAAPPDWPGPQRYAEALLEVRKLLWLIERNDAGTDPAAAKGLTRLLRVDPTRPDHASRLESLLEDARAEKSPLVDNIRLEIAKTYSDPYQRARALIALAEDELTDAAVEANYELGRLLMQSARAPGLGLLEGVKPPREYFRLVIAAPPNPWQPLAEAQLDWLPPENPDSEGTQP